MLDEADAELFKNSNTPWRTIILQSYTRERSESKIKLRSKAHKLLSEFTGKTGQNRHIKLTHVNVSS